MVASETRGAESQHRSKLAGEQKGRRRKSVESGRRVDQVKWVRGEGARQWLRGCPRNVGWVQVSAARSALEKVDGWEWRGWRGLSTDQRGARRSAQLATCSGQSTIADSTRPDWPE
eukprot:1399439-Pleurochrysis_carterae.AAC.1